MFAFTKLMQAMAAAGVVNDQYFNLTTLLLPGNGTNGAQNNTFLDSSTNNFTITRNGNVTQGSFSPFSQTGWANYFLGDGNRVQVPAGSAFAPGTGDFTLEAFVFVVGTTDGQMIYAQTASGNNYFMLAANAASGQYGFIGPHNTNQYSAVGSLKLNQWQHVVVARISGTVTMYVDGAVSGTPSTNTNNFSDTTYLPTVGGYTHTTSNSFNGYVSNLRYVKGVGVYTGAFTVPKTPLTATQSAGTNISAITGTQTSLLTCQSNRFVDNSTNNWAITLTGGTPSVQAFSPFAPTAAYSASTNGGSGYFDGTGDYLSLAASSAVVAAGDFTIEAWIYCRANNAYQGVISTRTVGNNSGYSINILNTGFLDFFCNNQAYASTSVPINQWAHVALVRSGTATNNISCYLNGSRIAQLSENTSTTNNVLVIGRYYNNSTDQYHFNGHISGARVVIGSALYSGATITIPTAPPTAVTNTALLLNFTNGGIIDATGKNVLETVGNAQISTTRGKWNGSSISLDGTNSYVLSSNTVSLPGDFTIEGWCYASNITSYHDVFSIGSGTNSLEVYIASPFEYITITGTFSIFNKGFGSGSFRHFAIVRYGTGSSNCRLYIDGVDQGSAATSNVLIQGKVSVGAQIPAARYLTGHINDFRITPYARYTANFTPPTQAFPLQ